MPWPLHIVAAAGLVADDRGNVLLVKTHNRGWDVPGGQVELGENLEEGVLREIFEESGVVASVRCLTGVYSNVGQHVYDDGVTHVPPKVIFDFLCDYVGGEPRPSDETSEVMWVPRERVLEYITAPVQRYRIGAMLAFDGRVHYASYRSRPEFELLTERFV